MTTASANPGDNFFSAVRDGVREAVRATVTVERLRLVPDSAPESDAAPEGETPKP